MSKTGPALRYHGGKFRLAPWIISFFPAHLRYVESFGGAAGVLLQKERAYAEIYNDLDSDVANFFQVLRDPISREKLILACILTPYARDEFNLAWIKSNDPIERARRLCVRAQMGFGSAGASKGSTGFRIDTKREYGTAQQLWTEFPSNLANAGKRFQGVLIENRPAIDVMRQHDGHDTLHFVDPPYMLSTRVLQSSGRGYYRHEMSDDDHAELIDALLDLKGYIVLSGYESDLYTSKLQTWKRYETTARISAARGTSIRKEVAWLNPACSHALNGQCAQRRMFA